MGLHVDIFTAEQLLCPLPGDILYHIHALASAVISLPRIAFRVFVGQGASHRRHHSPAHPVLRRDQLDMRILTVHLRPDGIRDLTVCFPDLFKIVHSRFLHISRIRIHMQTYTAFQKILLQHSHHIILLSCLQA